MKDFELRSSWIIQVVPKFNDKCSLERRAQVGGSSRMMRTPSETAEAGGQQKLPDILEEEGST